MQFLTSYQTFVIPIVVLIITQLLKFFIGGLFEQKWSFNALTAYGGMPSTHTATVIALLTIIGIQEGVTDPVFGVALIFAGITIRDAIGFRQFLGQHGHVLNLLAQSQPGKKKNPLPQMKEVIGHTPLEATLGGVIGFVLAIILWAAAN